MIDPKPGEPFETYGLTWEPRVCAWPIWVTRIDGHHVELELDTKRNLWGVFGSDGGFDTADEAIAWAIRTCPGARCGSCAYHRSHSCVAGSPFDMPTDGWCHQWEARLCER